MWNFIYTDVAITDAPQLWEIRERESTGTKFTQEDVKLVNIITSLMLGVNILFFGLFEKG